MIYLCSVFGKKKITWIQQEICQRSEGKLRYLLHTFLGIFVWFLPQLTGGKSRNAVLGEDKQN